MFSKKPFSLSTIRDATQVVIRPCGPLTLGSGADDARWTSQLEDTEGFDVTLDLSCVSDLDARGVGTLADLGGRALRRGLRMSVAAASAVTERLALLTGLDKAMPGDWHRRSRPARACCY